MDIGSIYAISAVAVMLGVTASQALGALLAQRDFTELAELARQLSASEDFSREDKKLAASLMQFATGWYTTPLMIIAIPATAVFVPLRALWLVAHGKQITPENIFGRKGRQGPFNALLSSVLFKSRPLLFVWMCVWAVPALIVLLVLGALRTAPALARRSIETILSRAAHQ